MGLQQTKLGQCWALFFMVQVEHKNQFTKNSGQRVQVEKNVANYCAAVSL